MGSLVPKLIAMGTRHRGTAEGRARRGHALMTSMMVVSTLLITGTALLDMTSQSGRTAARRLLNTQALNLAVSAAEHTLAQLQDDRDYAGLQATSLGQGTVACTVALVAGQPLYRQLTASASVSRAGLTATRRVRATVELAQLPLVFTMTIGSKKTLNIGGAVRANSAPVLNQGWVHSNQNLSVSSSRPVEGKASATGTISPGTASRVTGTTTAGAPPVEFPEITQAFKERGASRGAVWADLTVADGSTLPGKIAGNLTIATPGGATVDGVVWVTGALILNGPVAGTGAIVCDGGLSANTNATTPGGTPPNVAYISTLRSPTALDLSGNGQFRGLLYAPNGGIRMRGNATYYGSLLAESFDVGGGPTITRWTGLDDAPPPLPGSLKVLGWQEL